MTRLFIPLLLLLSFFSYSQTKSDTIRMIDQSLRLLDLQFSENEMDSMVRGINQLTSVYKTMHRNYPKNDIPYPLAFNPRTFGYEINSKQKPIGFGPDVKAELPVNKNDLAFYSIPQLASLIKNRKITSTELTKFFIDRLKKWGDTLECVITLTEDIAMQQAKAADQEIAQKKYRGILHGIPYGLKDLFAVKGTKTTWGTTPYKEQVIDEDAYVYQKLRAAGAILCAKLSLGSLAYDNRWFAGFTRNPWNLNQGSSGSSAGSAAATSAGLLPFAIGTETWGSIISPATRCGVTGLRPTFGTVSRFGGMVLCWSLDKIGPITRSAEDAAIVFSVIHGTDGKDQGAVDAAFNYDHKIDIKKLRIGYAENYFRRIPKEANEWKVLDVYRSMGANLQPVIFPDSAVYPYDMMNIVLNSEAAAAFDELTRTNRDDLIERQDRNFWPNIFRTGRLVPAVEYINTNRYRYILGRDVNAFMKNWDVIIVPTYGGNQLAITNLTGHPSICFPIGFSRNNAPQSITLLGNLYDEATIVAVAKAFQDKTQHHLKHPEKFKQ